MTEVYFDIETTGLFPEKARVTCIGFLHSEFGVRVFSGQDETMILEQASAQLFAWRHRDPELLLVSFNGLKFDVPFLLKRFAFFSSSDIVFNSYIYMWNCYGIQSNSSPLSRETHLDLMIVLSAKYEDVMGQKLSTGRLSKDGARQWLDIYEPRAGGATHCVMVAKTSSDWSPIWLHNSLDLFSTKNLFDKAKSKGWV